MKHIWVMNGILFAVAAFMFASCQSKKKSDSDDSKDTNADRGIEEFVEQANLKVKRNCSPEAQVSESHLSYHDIRENFKSKKVSKLEVTEWIIDQMIKIHGKVNLAFAYNSSSSQQADMKNPRVIIFSSTFENGTSDVPKFIATVAGGKGNDSIEIMEFSDEEWAFCLREVSYEQEGSKSPEFVDHPKICGDCHGKQETRPRWEPYPEWPGFFNSNGIIAKDSREHDKFLVFQTEAETNPLYKAILAKAGKNSLIKLNEQDHIVVYSDVVELATGLHYLNRRRIAQLITEDPKFKEYKYAYMAAAIGCPDIESYLSEVNRKDHLSSFGKVHAQTIEQMLNAHKNRVERIEADNEGAITIRDIFMNEDGARPVRTRITASLRYLSENRRSSPLDMSTWSMSFLPDAYAFAGHNNGIEHLAFLLHQRTKGVDQALWDKLKNDPALPFDEEYVDLMNETFYTKDWDSKLSSSCADLKKASLNLQKP